jgi:hypothetical protein
MTEAEWLTSRDPIEMLRSRRPGNNRRLRLFACACCQNLRGFINDARSLQAIEAAENWADGKYRFLCSNCDDEDILNHCRHFREHAKGCGLSICFLEDSEFLFTSS